MVRAIVVILITLAFSAVRLCGVKDDVFKDFAHVWAGSLFGGAIWAQPKWLFWPCFIGVVAVECLAAFMLYPIKGR